MKRGWLLRFVFLLVFHAVQGYFKILVDFNISDSVNGLLQSEEIYIDILLDTVVHMSPTLLGAGGIKKLKSGKLNRTFSSLKL